MKLLAASMFLWCMGTFAAEPLVLEYIDAFIELDKTPQRALRKTFGRPDRKMKLEGVEIWTWQEEMTHVGDIEIKPYRLRTLTVWFDEAHNATDWHFHNGFDFPAHETGRGPRFDFTPPSDLEAEFNLIAKLLLNPHLRESFLSPDLYSFGVLEHQVAMLPIPLAEATSQPEEDNESMMANDTPELEANPAQEDSQDEGQAAQESGDINATQSEQDKQTPTTSEPPPTSPENTPEKDLEAPKTEPAPEQDPAENTEKVQENTSTPAEQDPQGNVNTTQINLAGAHGRNLIPGPLMLALQEMPPQEIASEPVTMRPFPKPQVFHSKRVFSMPGDFRYGNWEYSRAKIFNLERETLLHKSDTSIYYQVRFEHYKPIARYFFVNDRLTAGSYLLRQSNTQTARDFFSAFHRLGTLYTRAYGNPQIEPEQSMPQTEEVITTDYHQRQRVPQKKIFSNWVWQTDKNTITLGLITYGTQNYIMVHYDAAVRHSHSEPDL